MSEVIAQFDPSAATSGSFVITSLSNGIGKLIFWNESNWTLDLTKPDGSGDIAPAWIASIYDLTGPIGSITWTQSKQANTNAPPISQVWVVAYRNNETISGVFPVALNRQSVVSGGMGNPVFSATVGFGSTTGGRQKLNVFNPPNSGVTMTFHSARVYDDNTGSPTANLAIVSGADLNLATPVTITSHTGSATPPVSVGHASSEDVAIQAIPGTIIEVMDVQSTVTMDFLAYPDTVTLAPGNNLLIDLAQSGTGHVVRHTLKWSESPLSIPTQVVNMATQTASNIVNDGNTNGTGILESTPSGAGQTAHVTNDGLWLLSVLQSGVLHQFLKTEASGNPLQLGQSGDKVEFLGNVGIDGYLNINTIDDNVNGNTALDLSAGDGTVAFPQIIKPDAGGTILYGSVNGTATLFIPIWGSALKVVIVAFNAYQSASAPTLSLPGTMTAGMFLSGNFGALTITPQLNGVNSTASVITALASTGGTGTGINAIAKNSIGELAGAANELLLSTVGLQVGRQLILIGV